MVTIESNKIVPGQHCDVKPMFYIVKTWLNKEQKAKKNKKKSAYIQFHC